VSRENHDGRLVEVREYRTQEEALEAIRHPNPDGTALLKHE
jgi:hypothetical protein